MLLELAPEWSMDIDRGPDWLFIRPQPPSNQNPDHHNTARGDSGEVPLAEMVWKKLEQCFCYRVVLELDSIDYLRTWMIGKLVRLHKLVTGHGGMLGLCGVSREAEAVLRIARL